MNELVVNVDTVKVMHSVTMTIHLRGARIYAVRRWIGIRIMRFAAWVLGVQFEVEA